MNYGSLPEWLTFAAIYLWAGSWCVTRVDDNVGWTFDKKGEKAAYFTLIIFWPLLLCAIPFYKGSV